MVNILLFPAYGNDGSTGLSEVKRSLLLSQYTYQAVYYVVIQNILGKKNHRNM